MCGSSLHARSVDGVELARDVVNGPPGTAPLLRAGVKLSARYATLLPKAGVGSVWIEDDLGESIDVVEPLTPETRAKVHRATGDAISAAGGALRSGSGMPAAVVDSLADVASAMVNDLLDCPDAALALDDLSSFDDYTHRHSVQVTVLGLLDRPPHLDHRRLGRLPRPPPLRPARGPDAQARARPARARRRQARGPAGGAQQARPADATRRWTS